MVHSIHTNLGSTSALQRLNATNRGLEKTNENISTGKKINGPKDDAATLAIVQAMLSVSSGTQAVRDGLDRTGAAIDVAAAAGGMIAETLVEMKGLAVAASQQGLDQQSRDALNAQFAALGEQISGIVDTADFGGINLLAPGAPDLDVLSNENGDAFTVQAQDFSNAGLGIDAASLDSAANAASALTALDAAIAAASSKLGDLGASANRVETQSEFLSKLSDTLAAGVGNLIDADLAAESAALEAGRVKQELGALALGIANAAPKRLLALFQ